MSRCQHCLQGFCKKHPLQDHGERTAKLLEKATVSSSSNLKALLDAQIQKLQFEANQIAESEKDSSFRQQLDKDRKIVSAKRPYDDMQAIPGGLAPSVAMLMQQNSSEELDAIAGEEESSKRKKRKRHKKDKSDKKLKKKSSKKHKKDKSKKKRRSKDDSGDDKSQSSSNSSSTSSSK